MELYHGSDTAIDQPEISFNKGFSDLGQGFYLTDSFEAAAMRARSRARKTSTPSGVVSIFHFDERSIDWVVWDDGGPAFLKTAARDEHAPFGLSFASNRAGIVAWMSYIKACRSGETALPVMGDPAVVRAWIATEEVEIACSGFATAQEMAEFVNPAKLVMQYCFRNQEILNRLLAFSRAEEV